jgi:hypothetical protein
MNHSLKILIFVLIVFTLSCRNYTDNNRPSGNSSSENIESDNIPAGLKKLLKAYPDFLDSADENTLYWKDGTQMVYDDGIQNKTHDEKLDNPDLEDQMSQQYTKGADWGEPPSENFEPGRIRYEQFFKKMYGNTSSEANRNLVNVRWVDGTNVSFSSVNGAADSLESAANDLLNLGNEYMKYLSGIGGTFNWRFIAGTTRLSNHSFGTAIDIATKYSNYWKWQGDLTYRNQIPIEIVEVFEKHGFIWGGKWYHYDTMHFEYRPELLLDVK